MPSLPLVVVAGHLCLDIFPDLSHLSAEQFAASYQPGRLVEVERAIISTGGPVSNTGLVLHKLGMPTRLICKAGADLFGQAIQSVVASFGSHLIGGMVIDPTTSSSYTLIISPPGADRIFLHHAGANDTFCAADINYAQLAEAALFHFGYPPLLRRMYENNGAELVQIFQRAHAARVITSLDMSLPDPNSPSGQADWPTILGATLPYVDIFLPSIEELLFTLHRQTYEQMCKDSGRDGILVNVTPELLGTVSDDLLRREVKIVIIKLGERGLYLRTAPAQAFDQAGWRHAIDGRTWGGLELWAPCFQVKVVGTTGSGDSTIAGFLSGLLRGLSPYETMTMAVAVGACNVEAADALGGIRTWEETRQRIAAGWPRHTLHLNAPGWQWDAENSLWYRSN